MNKIVLGVYERPGLPFSRAACAALADAGVKSAIEHWSKYGHLEEVGGFDPETGIQHLSFPPYDGADIERHHPALIHVVESLGSKASRWQSAPAGTFNATLRIVEIEGSKYRIRKDKQSIESVVVPAKWTVIK